MVFDGEVFCHLASFQSILMISLKNSGTVLQCHGIHVGTVFVGCILYADDIVLLSANCYGLQKMVWTYAAIMLIDLGYGLIPRRVKQLSLEGVLPSFCCKVK